MKGSSDRDRHGEIGAFGRIKVEEEVVGMLKIGKATGPRVVVDAAKAGQKEKGSAIVGGRVVNFFSALFGIEGHGCEPFRDALAQVFLKESLALDSVRIAPQNQRPIAEKGQNEVGHAVVVGQQIPFRVARLGKVDFIQIAQSQPFAVELNGNGF